MALRSIGTHAPRKSRLITQSRADYLLFTVRAPLLLLVTVHMLQNDLSHEYERGGERTRRLAEHSDQASLFWTGPYTLSINNNVKKKKIIHLYITTGIMHRGAGIESDVAKMPNDLCCVWIVIVYRRSAWMLFIKWVRVE